MEGEAMPINAPNDITVAQSSCSFYVVHSRNSLIRRINPLYGAVLTISGNIFLSQTIKMVNHRLHPSITLLA
jgi:hypothetical protein